MEVGGQFFSEPIVQRIAGQVAAQPSLSRRQLASQVCRWLDWRAPNGEFQEMAARKALPLGLIDAQVWARDPQAHGQSAQRHRRPQAEKESQKWLDGLTAVSRAKAQAPALTWVSVADQEADCYALFDQARAEVGGPELLVRARHNRATLPTLAPLRAHLATQRPAGIQTLHVPRQGRRRARRARLEIRLGRHHPDVPCTEYFEEAQWQARVAFVYRDPKKAEEPPPPLRTALRMVAELGGFLGRKGDGEPGAQTLWRGLQRLDDITLSWIAFRSGGTLLDALVSSQRGYG